MHNCFSGIICSSARVWKPAKIYIILPGSTKGTHTLNKMQVLDCRLYRYVYNIYIISKIPRICFRHVFVCDICSFQDLFHNKDYFGAFDEEKWEYESGSKYQRLLHLVRVHQPYPNMCLPMQVRIIPFLSSSNQNQGYNGTMISKIIQITKVTWILAKQFVIIDIPIVIIIQLVQTKSYSTMQ